VGWSHNPGEIAASGGAATHATPDRSRVLLWHANYHPDGGQLFCPTSREPFIMPLAPPDDEVTPQDFVAYYVEAGRGLYILPRAWHEAVFPLAGRARFFDRQGKVHARISCHFPEELGVFMSVPLHAPRA
jgi:ureidoglycolate hydrolase